MRVAAFMLLVGCGFSNVGPMQIIGGDDEPLHDAALIDVPVVMLDACVTYSTQVNTCTVPVGSNMPLDLTGMNTYSSLTGMLTRGDDDPMPIPHATVMTSTGTIDVIFASSFSLAEGGTLRLSGPLPVAIAVSGTAQIDGLIDLRGPAAGSRTDMACGNSAGEKGQDDGGGGGGGGGGAFQGAGGDGSDGDADRQNNDEGKGGDGGTKIAARPTGLLGGCDGGAGGEAGGSSGQGGDGGGAVLIAAGVSITVGADGAINAGGGGGSRGGGNGRAGGGGGSGGMILLESKQVTINGVLAANGGGGGEGNTNGRSGQAGLASSEPAQGGAGGDSNGGDGADGGAGNVLDGSSTNDQRNGGGGGGGGGVGFIAIGSPSISTTGTISPMFMPWP